MSEGMQQLSAVGIPVALNFANDYIHTFNTLWYGDMTTETVSSWFLLKLKVVQLT